MSHRADGVSTATALNVMVMLYSLAHPIIVAAQSEEGAGAGEAVTVDACRYNYSDERMSLNEYVSVLIT